MRKFKITNGSKLIFLKRAICKDPSTGEEIAKLFYLKDDFKKAIESSKKSDRVG